MNTITNTGEDLYVRNGHIPDAIFFDLPKENQNSRQKQVSKIIKYFEKIRAYSSILAKKNGLTVKNTDETISAQLSQVIDINSEEVAKLIKSPQSFSFQLSNESISKIHDYLTALEKRGGNIVDIINKPFHIKALSEGPDQSFTDYPILISSINKENLNKNSFPVKDGTPTDLREIAINTGLKEKHLKQIFRQIINFKQLKSKSPEPELLQKLEIFFQYPGIFRSSTLFSQLPQDMEGPFITDLAKELNLSEVECPDGEQVVNLLTDAPRIVSQYPEISTKINKVLGEFLAAE